MHTQPPPPRTVARVEYLHSTTGQYHGIHTEHMQNFGGEQGALHKPGTLHAAPARSTAKTRLPSPEGLRRAPQLPRTHTCCGADSHRTIEAALILRSGDTPTLAGGRPPRSLRAPCSA
eukprot:6100821-Prymnesium_polylepis.2